MDAGERGQSSRKLSYSGERSAGSLPSNAAQGNTGCFKYVTDQAQNGLGIDKHRPSQAYGGYKHLSPLPYKQSTK